MNRTADIKFDRDGNIVSIRSPRDHQSKRETVSDVKKHTKFKKVMAAVGTLALAGSIVHANIVKPFSEKKQIDSKVESINSLKDYEKDFLKEKLRDSYNAYNAPSYAYSNPKQAYNLLEAETLDEAKKNGNIENMDKFIKGAREIIWEDGFDSGEPGQHMKEADVKAAKEDIDSWKKLQEK